MNDHDKVLALIETCRWVDRHGWVPATSGNFSVRLAPERIAITVSGRHKGRLTPEDIMQIDLEGRPLDTDQRSSAETGLHTQLYRHDPRIQAVLHVHSPAATLLSRQSGAEVVLEDFELLKAFAGIHTHATRMRVPVLENDQDIPHLAAAVAPFLRQDPPIYGYLIRGHGLYTWGQSLQEAARYLEAFDFLFECVLRETTREVP